MENERYELLMEEKRCDLVDMIDKLKAELHQQKFNNKNNLSIDGQMSDEIARLKAENEKLNFSCECWAQSYCKAEVRFIEEIKKLEQQNKELKQLVEESELIMKRNCNKHEVDFDDEMEWLEKYKVETCIK